MEEYLDKIKALLAEDNREGVYNYIFPLLQTGKLDVIDLYEKILTPSLDSITCETKDKRICIWQEHVRTAIVRSIIECCFPYVMEKKRQFGYPCKGSAVILCPQEEYHEIGARMTADFFTICGYDTIFVGSNTPYEDFYNGIEIIKPTVIGISVSNFYNLIAAKRIIRGIRKRSDNSVRIFAGGYAIDQNIENAEIIGADGYIKSFKDVLNISETEAVK